jgi:hypothetical protein
LNGSRGGSQNSSGLDSFFKNRDIDISQNDDNRDKLMQMMDYQAKNQKPGNYRDSSPSEDPSSDEFDMSQEDDIGEGTEGHNVPNNVVNFRPKMSL